jgi:hypothetical protein
VVVLAAACGGGGSDPDLIPGKPPSTAPVATNGACSDLFDDAVVTTYDIQIDPAEWALIHDEFVNWQLREANGLDLTPYHAILFRNGGEEAPAWIRLKGNSSWFEAVAKDPNVKKQFVIAFDQGIDTKARFHGVQKVELDMPTIDLSYLHERLAQSFLRDIGLPNLCANSAKLIVNGAYYGLYANLEYMNKDFLKRVFPGESDGDLWKKGRELKTNENDPNHDDSRKHALWATSSVSDLTTLMDMDASIRTWAAEALMPQSDGYWGAGSNFYVYDHPTRGFIWLTDDLDGTFEFMPPDMHPMYFWLNRDYPRKPGPQYVAVMADEMWRNRFVETLAQLVEAWDAGGLQARIDRWSAQIAEPLATDPNRCESLEVHQAWQRRLRDFMVARPDAVRRWLACYNGGGPDADADGVTWCRDCDDAVPTSYPGAPEICGDGIDQNCNGLIDDC